MTTIAAFGAYGVELEYAIVDRDTLDVAPFAAALLDAMPEPVDRGGVIVGWSNEIVAHVAEIKNVEPVCGLASLPDPFQDEIRAANVALASANARLMPSGMHPWMAPRQQSVLWTRDNAAIYEAYDRLFDCRRHGWANVQSMHINLPFAGDAQFARLLSSIRLVLPLIPALAASSPIVDGHIAPERDHRLAVYATHAARFPEIAADVIPEACDTRSQYEREVLLPMYDAVASHDPAGILRHEWLNARGAIARFDRNAIEIRLADTQESPRADIAVAGAVSSVVRMLYEERLTSAPAQRAFPTAVLAAQLRAAIRDGEDAIADEGYLRVLGMRDTRACPLRDAWRRLLDEVEGAPFWSATAGFMLDRGTLATRILRAVGARPSRACLREVYAGLAQCLEEGRLFD